MFLKPKVNKFPELSNTAPPAYCTLATATEPSVVPDTPVPYRVLTAQAAEAGEGVLEAV
jgi:hypothetical protein